MIQEIRRILRWRLPDAIGDISGPFARSGLMMGFLPGSQRRSLDLKSNLDTVFHAPHSGHHDLVTTVLGEEDRIRAHGHATQARPLGLGGRACFRGRRRARLHIAGRPAVHRAGRRRGRGRVSRRRGRCALVLSRRRSSQRPLWIALQWVGNERRAVRGAVADLEAGAGRPTVDDGVERAVEAAAVTTASSPAAMRRRRADQRSIASSQPEVERVSPSPVEAYGPSTPVVPVSAVPGDLRGGLSMGGRRRSGRQCRCD